MTDNIRLKGFKDDTWLNGIGDLFCRKDAMKWGVNLSIYPGKETGRDATFMSNAPILVRKRLINSTKPHRRNWHNKQFTIETTALWNIERLHTCPALERRLPKELGQYCFVFSLADGTRIYLPQFELARALFFHNSYLARSCIGHDLLRNEFAVEYDSSTSSAIINVLETCNCPVELFNDYGYRRVLAWLLIDKEARQSYDSIGNYQLSSGRNIGAYRIWTFQFDPPLLENAGMKVRGHFDPNSSTLLVYEITDISNVPADLPEIIEFYSPKFYQQVSGKGGSSGTGSHQPPQHQVDDSGEESRENKPLMISESKVRFDLAKAIKTAKVSLKKKLAGIGRKDDSVSAEASPNVSTEEQGIAGSLPSAEWDNLNELTDDTHLYTNKFQSYFEMLKLLREQHGCEVTVYPLRKLPAIGKCKKHLLATDGNPRCLSVAYVSVGKNSYYLLEVDTSDASKALSTKVIHADKLGDIRMHLRELEIRLLKCSLSWPKEYLVELVGEDYHFGVPHQKSDRSGSLTIKDTVKWAIRTYLSIIQ